MDEINDKEIKKYTIRINRILDLISNFGLEVERNVVSISEYRNKKKYHRDYNRYFKYDLVDYHQQTFHIKEIKDWVFNIELLKPEKPYDPEAIIWGMWIPGITKYKFSATPYMVTLRIDPHGKENNCFWENDKELKEMFIHIIKNKWASRYYSYIGKYSLFNGQYRYLSSKKAKKYLNKIIKKQQLILKKREKVKDFIVDTSIPIHSFFKHIDVEEVLFKEDDNTYNMLLIVYSITDKYKNKLETLAYKNKINLKIQVRGVEEEDEE